jgi:hypothetical protein
MTFDQIITDVLGISYGWVAVYYDSDNSAWKRYIGGSGATTIVVADMDAAKTDAETYVSGTLNKRVISKWLGTTVGGFAASQAIYA